MKKTKQNPTKYKVLEKGYRPIGTLKNPPLGGSAVPSKPPGTPKSSEESK